jgi:hypothetical protein
MEHDSPWKEVVEDLFEAFLSFFFPHVHKAIDFSKGYQFLERELQQIVKTSKTGRRFADKLVKVYLKNGSERWLLIHLEIQGYKDKKFPERMYIYNYRIFDKFRKTVISLALLTDDDPRFRPNEYRRSNLGCEVSFRYPLVKVIDYRDRVAELEASSHPFAIIVLAFLKTLETEGNVQERYRWKKHFLLELYTRGMKRETILAIYKFIDWVMELPEKLDTKIYHEIKTTKEAKAMPHITTAERIGLEKGLEKGLERGMEKGQKAAMQQAIATVILAKFGKPGRPLIERSRQVASLKILERMLARLAKSQNLSEAAKVLDEIELPSKKKKKLSTN